MVMIKLLLLWVLVCYTVAEIRGLDVLEVDPKEISVEKDLGKKKTKEDTRFYVDGRWIRDGDGRARIFHGTNAVEKIHPFVPVFDGPDCKVESGPVFERALCDRDMDNLKKWGFNIIRLGVMWQAVVPVEGQVNRTYLGEVKKLVNKLHENGFSVLIDAHQDVLARKICGEGIPDWAFEKALNLSNWDRSSSWKQFPFPYNYDLPVDNATGYPDTKFCQKHDFGTFYFSLEAQAALGALWSSESLWDDFAFSWKAVAETLHDTPGVIGYELFNEPMNRLLTFDLIKALSDKKTLLPLYRKLHEAIRSVDNRTIVFYEPLMAGEYVGIINDLLVSDFTKKDSPGGEAYLDRQAYSYHVYCQLDEEGSPEPPYWGCDLFSKRSMQMNLDITKNLGGASMLTEFGAVGNSKESVQLLNLMTSLADHHMQSWIYWTFKSFDDITTSNPHTETFYYKNGTLQQEKVDALTRTYARIIAGTPVSMEFSSNKTFTLTFVPHSNKNCETEIFVHQMPTAVETSHKGVVSWKYDREKSLVHVTHDRRANIEELTIKISFH